MKNLAALLLLVLCFTANASELADANRAAVAQVLSGLSSSSREGKIEADYLALQLDRFASRFVKPGPFCLELREGCFTRRQLGYRAGEHYALGRFRNLPKIGIYVPMVEARYPTFEALEKARRILERNGTDELTLMYAIEAQEQLALVYLEDYAKKNPPRAARDEGSLHYSYSWQVNEDGDVVQVEAVWGDGD
ncbi:MAG: hypothetical protein HY075_07465 [Deltaproteobacteria bacterium]|nr:hypothetical protein [Deltaproteobacteria bacterium]